MTSEPWLYPYFQAAVCTLVVLHIIQWVVFIKTYYLVVALLDFAMQMATKLGFKVLFQKGK